MFTGCDQGEETTRGGRAGLGKETAVGTGAGLPRGGNPKTSRLTPPAPFTDFDPLFLQTMQPTFRPHKLKRARKIGYRARKATRGGRAVLANRRRKGRKRLTVV